MKEIDILTKITARGYDELSPEERELTDAAWNATKGAYAPYSNFSVGAAIRLDNGVIVTGANQENAAFSSGTCAERSACFYAGANYPQAKFTAIAIAAVGTDKKRVPNPVAPCGACRQALLEYETLAGHNVPVMLLGENEVYTLPSVKSLMPLAFTEF
ncbi:MAG: cytidine deaminase [Muribaculaceae bacterium]|nr:cytidine deaminase [Muribaculaceae bacterium]